MIIFKLILYQILTSLHHWNTQLQSRTRTINSNLRILMGLNKTCKH